ncbi:MAG TPA: hypothetical protein VIM58_05360 [Candidatus Methylacidiphilales bacterium]
MPASAKITALRQLLSEKGFSSGIPTPESAFTTGLSAVDEHEVPQRGITEIVGSPTEGTGGTLLLYGLVHAMRDERVAIVDATDSFDPSSVSAADLPHLLWVRCSDSLQASKAADMVLRDGNVSLAILLLSLASPSELRRIHANVWHRLQVLSEQSAVPLLAFTPTPIVGNAKLRLNVHGQFPLRSVTRSRSALLPSMRLTVQKRRLNLGGGDVRRAASA